MSCTRRILALLATAVAVVLPAAPAAAQSENAKLKKALTREMRAGAAASGSYVVDVDTGHFGLFGMRERAEKLRGALAIDSTPGGGTTISLKIPVQAPAAVSDN